MIVSLRYWRGGRLGMLETVSFNYIQMIEEFFKRVYFYILTALKTTV
jgi:hypothetical protein